MLVAIWTLKAHQQTLYPLYPMANEGEKAESILYYYEIGFDLADPRKGV